MWKEEDLQVIDTMIVMILEVLFIHMQQKFVMVEIMIVMGVLMKWRGVHLVNHAKMENVCLYVWMNV